MRLRLLSFAAGLIATSLSFTILPFTSSAQDSRTPLDLLILHGKLIDGSGQGARQADVGMRGDRIVFIGDSKKAHVEATRTIDATGLIVAPGFIDPHTHTLGDLTNDQTKSNQAYLMQGVITVITGNDGGSVINIGDSLRKWDEQGMG